MINNKFFCFPIPIAPQLSQTDDGPDLGGEPASVEIFLASSGYHLSSIVTLVFFFEL